MKAKVNESYEDLAIEWQFELIKILKENLRKNNIDVKTAKEICGDFAFDLSMLQDQGEIKNNSPIICFDDLNGNLIYNSNEDINLHEYAFGNTDLAFE